MSDWARRQRITNWWWQACACFIPLLYCKDTHTRPLKRKMSASQKTPPLGLKQISGSASLSRSHRFLDPSAHFWPRPAFPWQRGVDEWRTALFQSRVCSVAKSILHHVVCMFIDMPAGGRWYGPIEKSCNPASCFFQTERNLVLLLLLGTFSFFSWMNTSCHGFLETVSGCKGVEGMNFRFRGSSMLLLHYLKKNTRPHCCSSSHENRLLLLSARTSSFTGPFSQWVFNSSGVCPLPLTYSCFNFRLQPPVSTKVLLRC